MSGALIYKLTVGALFAILLISGGLDFRLWWNDEVTVSEWLQENPQWFIIPLALLLTFIFLLTLHLYCLPASWGGVSNGPRVELQ